MIIDLKVCIDVHEGSFIILVYKCPFHQIFFLMNVERKQWLREKKAETWSVLIF